MASDVGSALDENCSINAFDLEDSADSVGLVDDPNTKKACCYAPKAVGHQTWCLISTREDCSPMSGSGLGRWPTACV